MVPAFYVPLAALAGIIIGGAFFTWYTRRHMPSESAIIKLVHEKGDQVSAQLHQRVSAVRADLSKVQGDVATLKQAAVTRVKAVTSAATGKSVKKSAPKKSAPKKKS